MEKLKEIERSIIKKYRKELWSKFIKCVKDYKLINENDKIAVCISGGKDSFLMAKLMQELKRHGKVNFDLYFIVMDPGYSKVNRKHIIDMGSKLGIELNIFNSTIFDVVSNVTDGNPCYLCARMRRGYLYNYAKELGCNKIALGHHFDDVVETVLLNMIYGSEIKSMMPKLHSTNFKGMELIRPMYLIKEADIISWCNSNNLEFINCACDFTKESEFNEDVSKRKEMKLLINELRKKYNKADYNIFKSVQNINLNTVISYKKNNKIYNFLDEYDDE